MIAAELETLQPGIYWYRGKGVASGVPYIGEWELVEVREEGNEAWSFGWESPFPICKEDQIEGCIIGPLDIPKPDGQV